MKSITERHQYILAKLNAVGLVNTLDLSSEMKVSQVTIRKDLKLLEDKKLLFRTHGRGSKINPYISDKPVAEKEQLHSDEKQLIAKAAAVKICGLEQIQHIITDNGIAHATVKQLEDRGIRVTVI